MCPCLHPRQSALLLGCRLGLLLLCGLVFFVPHTKRGRRSRDFEHRWHGTNTRWHFYSETPTKILFGMNAKREPRLILYTIFAFATCLHNLSDLLVYVSVKLYIVSIVYHTYLRILYVCPVLYERLSIDHSVTPTRLSHIFLIGWVGI